MNDVAPVYREEFLTRDPNTIKVHEELRIRQSTPLLEQQIVSMMSSFQTIGQLHRISIDVDDYLISGYVRLIAAKRLKMKIKVVKKHGLSDYQKFQIEMQENATRTDFTSYEFTIGLAQLKRKYEFEHPETKWGRNRYVSRMARSADLKKEFLLGFVKKNAKLFNLSERTMRDKIRIGEAILDGFFDEKTIKLFKNDKITYTDLRERIRNRERLKKEKEELLSKKKKLDQKTEEQITPKPEESEKQEDGKIPEPNVDSKPDKPNNVKDSGSKESLPVLPPPPSPPQEDEQETKVPLVLSGGNAIKKFDIKTKSFIEQPATCKDCPLGKPFACHFCKGSMVRCIPECKEGKLGIYMGNHLACWRYGELIKKEKKNNNFLTS